MLGIVGGKRRRGRQKKRWIDTTSNAHLEIRAPFSERTFARP